MLTVAIAVEPPTQPVAAEQAVAKSCQAALGRGRCQAESELLPAAVVAWFAVVRVDDGEPGRLTIEFHDRSRGGVLIESRTLDFDAASTTDSRLASAGAVIAAFVAARQQGGGDEPVRPPPRAVVEERPPAPPPEPARGPWWNVDLAAFAGPALESGPYRLGGLGRVIVSLPEAPGVLGLVSGRYAERPGELNLTFWSAACGFGARVGAPSGWISAELTGELAFERMIALARDGGGREEQREQNRLGGRLSVTSAWSITDSLAFLLGAEASVLRPTVSITVGGDTVGRVPAVSYALSSGLRLRF